MTAMHNLALERTSGALRLAFTQKNGATWAAETFQSGALRVRFPRPASEMPEAVLINTAGGLTGGDRLAIKVSAGSGARALVCGQACEKIYKSAGGPAVISTDLAVGAKGYLDWLPQPCILFDRARLNRVTRISMAGDARLLALEAVILGRTAMNENFTQGVLNDRWYVSRDGGVIFADAIRLKGTDHGLRERPWALGAARAFAMLLYVAPDAQSRLAEMRSCLAEAQETVAASAWNGFMVVRFAARDGHSLMKDLVGVLTRFRQAPMPRMWSI